MHDVGDDVLVKVGQDDLEVGFAERAEYFEDDFFLVWVGVEDRDEHEGVLQVVVQEVDVVHLSEEVEHAEVEVLGRYHVVEDRDELAEHLVLLAEESLHVREVRQHRLQDCVALLHWSERGY